MITSPVQKTMHAAAIDRFGGIETFKLQTLPVPQIGPDEILIRVESAGVGAWDPWEREGEFAKMFGTKPRFPYVIGYEGAGTIAAVGERVKDFKEGDRVWGVRPFEKHRDGFYAEYAAVPTENTSRVPDKLTTEQAGVALADAATGLRGLDHILGVKRANR
jgi:NADPH2:quinone reductase